MKNNSQMLILLILLFLVAACQDIVVPDIENDTVILLSPPDELITTSATLTFWWEEVPDAEKYNLQIVSSRFDSITDIIADTNLSRNKFENVLLYPGEFQWRVKAYNTVSETPFSTRSFQIDSTETVDQVVLLQPLNNTYTNETSVLFQWRDQEIADFYRFKLLLGESTIVDENLETSSVLLPDDLSVINEISEGEYSWQVQALNDFSQSQFSSYNLTVDRTAPSKPILQSPANADTLTSTPVLLSWERPNTSGAPLADSLFIYRDTTTNDPFIEILLSEPEYSLTGSGNGKYYWKVKSVDQAGNEGVFSLAKWFFVSE